MTRAITLSLVAIGFVASTAGPTWAQNGGIQSDQDAINDYKQGVAEITGDDNDNDDLPTQKHLFNADQGLPKEPGGNVVVSPDDPTTKLFGTGGPDDPYNRAAAAVPQWQDMNEIDSKHYRDSAEMRLRDELHKPLPERRPFGDQLQDIEHTLGK